MQKRFAFKLIAAASLAAVSFISFAQQAPIKIAALVELSGAGASSGTQFHNGIKLAVADINAAGGILGRKLELSSNDTTTRPTRRHTKVTAACRTTCPTRRWRPRWWSRSGGRRSTPARFPAGQEESQAARCCQDPWPPVGL